VIGQFHASAASAQGKDAPTSTSEENGWAAGTVWKLWRREKSFSPAGGPVRSLVSTVLSRLSSNIKKEVWIGWLNLLHLIHSHSSGLQVTQRYRYLHTFQFTVTHALGLSDFTSRILTTDLSQSHCHFKLQVKSSLHILIAFLPLSCSCQLRRFDSIPSIAPWDPRYLASRRTPRKTPFYVIKDAYLLVRCLATGVLLLRAGCVAGMCLPTRCLAMGIHVTISIRYMELQSKNLIYILTVIEYSVN
jgi:hypothetical protein